jgi:8-oxo-dGTP diphosphatase
MTQGYTYKYPHPAVTSDCVVFGFDGKELKILLVERRNEPCKGCWAFPGGFMNIDETVEQCAKRELEEETGLKLDVLEQFHTFSKVDRDPRERVITVAFIGLVKQAEVKGGDDAAKAQWFPIKDIPQLAFDHDYILRLAQRTLKERIHFESIGFDLMDEEFSMPELQRLYEAILEVKFDRRNFEKKMMRLGILDQIEQEEDTPKPAFKCLTTKDFDSLFETKPMTGYSCNYETAQVLQEAAVEYSISRGKKRKFRFNRKKYDEMKEKGIFRIEF